MTLAAILSLAGIALAYVLYVRRPDLPDRLTEQWSSLYIGSLHKWYVDELYDAHTYRPNVAQQIGKPDQLRVPGLEQGAHRYRPGLRSRGLPYVCHVH